MLEPTLLYWSASPADLAREVTEGIGIATIGIGAGHATDAQVLVAHDLLGLSERPARFVKNFLTSENIFSDNPIKDAFSSFDKSVKAGTYPAAEHQYN